MKLTLPALYLAALAAVFPVHADNAAIDNIRDMLKARFPTITIHSVKPSAVPGLVQVVAGTQVVYFDEAGKYMIDGAVVELDTKRNLTEEAKSGIRLRTLEQLKEDELLVYRPEKVAHTVTVVTDIDCPYCRKLHSEMDDYMKNNIEVRYIFMPLKGARDLKKTVSVWCSDDRNLALDIAKSGGEVDDSTCSHPISKHKRVANELGIRGTPAIVLEDGSMLPGYVPVGELLKKIQAAES